MAETRLYQSVFYTCLAIFDLLTASQYKSVKFRLLAYNLVTLLWHFFGNNVDDTDTDTCLIWCIEWYVLGFMSYIFFGDANITRITNVPNSHCTRLLNSVTHFIPFILMSDYSFDDLTSLEYMCTDFEIVYVIS